MHKHTARTGMILPQEFGSNPLAVTNSGKRLRWARCGTGGAGRAITLSHVRFHVCPRRLNARPRRRHDRL